MAKRPASEHISRDAEHNPLSHSFFRSYGSPFSDCPYQLYSVVHTLLTLETWCGYGYDRRPRKAKCFTNRLHLSPSNLQQKLSRRKDHWLDYAVCIAKLLRWCHCGTKQSSAKTSNTTLRIAKEPPWATRNVFWKKKNLVWKTLPFSDDHSGDHVKTCKKHIPKIPFRCHCVDTKTGFSQFHRVFGTGKSQWKRRTQNSACQKPLLPVIISRCEKLEHQACGFCVSCCARVFRHSAGLHARVILDGATCRLNELGDVMDVLSVLVVWLNR